MIEDLGFATFQKKGFCTRRPRRLGSADFRPMKWVNAKIPRSSKSAEYLDLAGFHTFDQWVVLFEILFMCSITVVGPIQLIIVPSECQKPGKAASLRASDFGTLRFHNNHCWAWSVFTFWSLLLVAARFFLNESIVKEILSPRQLE